MNGKHDNRKREWIKVQLGDDQESRHAGDIVALWKETRRAAQFVRRAVIIYHGLQAGNLEPLFEDFPMLAQLMTTRSATYIQESPAQPMQRGQIKREAVQKSVDEDKDDLLEGFGL
jgi:hypothetical protein